MSSRALSLATVQLLVGCFAAGSAFAQVQNLEAGKTPSQIFAGTCNACHKSPRGLLKSVPASSLPSFLRQHYTTSSDMASVLAGFLVSNGAADTRYQAKDQPKLDQPKQDQAKQGRDAKQEARQSGALPQQAVRPDVDGTASQADRTRQGRNARRLPRPGDGPETAKPAEDQTPEQAATDAKQGARQKLGKRGRPGTDEAPRVDAAKDNATKSETAKSDTAKPDIKPDIRRTDAAKGAGDKPEAAKASGEGKSDAAKDSPKETDRGDVTPLRPDPVPAVTPAAPSAPTVSVASEPAVSPSAPAIPAPSLAAPPVAAAVAPAGPPVPPISQ